MVESYDQVSAARRGNKISLFKYLWYNMGMQMKLLSPSKLLLPDDSEQVKRFLTYHDRQIKFQISKMKRNYRWMHSDPDGYLAALDKLKILEKQTLVFYDLDGRPYTYSGLWKELQQRFGWEYDIQPVKQDKMPVIPWAHAQPTPFYYQQEAVDELLKFGHGAVELPTGSGKSLVIKLLVKNCPVKTLIATPSSAITDQLYSDFVDAFGQKYVGKYGDGSKTFKKKFIIATAQSLTRLEPDSEIYQELAKSEMFIFDESHTCPADTFEKVCTGVAADARLRFFTSATQLRNDGAELLLKGITGPIVYGQDFKKLVEEEYLARPVFKMFKVPQYGAVGCQDVKQETRNQLYNNPNVASLAGEIASKAVTLGNRQTIVIIEEFRQFVLLKNFLTTQFEFVHGGASKDAKEYLPKEYWVSDTEAAIKRFNAGETRLLIGTSAISTGVDLKPTQCIIYLQGGTSEIKVKQALGRGTRIKGVPNKKDFWVVDFIVQGSDAMERHAEARREIYDTMGNVEIIG